MSALRDEFASLQAAAQLLNSADRLLIAAGAGPHIQLDHDPHFIQDPIGAARYERFVAKPVSVYLVIGATLWFSWPEGTKQPRIIHINPNPETHLRYDQPVTLTMGAEDALLGLDFVLRRLRR